jgi:PAS domain S-box-containing protein
LEEKVVERTSEIIYQKELLESITEGIEEGILLLSKDLRIQWANKKLKEQTGYTDEEILGKHCYKITHRMNKKCKRPDDVCPIDQVLETGKAATEVHVHYDKSNQENYVEVTAYPVKENGEISGYVHISRDITEKMRVEEEVRRLKEFNENIVQSMEEGVLLENDEGIITFANPRMLEMIGVPREEVVGKNLIDIFTPGSRRSVEEKNSQIRRGVRSRFEAILDLGGKELPVLVSATPFMEDELYVGNLKVFVDITERKEAEEKLRYRALRYKVEKGRSYLITEKSMEKGLDVFNDLQHAGYKGMIISRTPPEHFKEELSEDPEILWLSGKGKGRGTIPPELNIVKKRVEDFASGNAVILLDRLDYLIVQNEFSTVLRVLQELNEVVYLNRSILLMVIDDDILSNQELSLLEKEFVRVEAKHKLQLEKEILEILKFIKKENEVDHAPAHKEVAKEFNITRPTSIKRLNELKRKGLIIDRKKGRFKTLELTKKGKEVI